MKKVTIALLVGFAINASPGLLYAQYKFFSPKEGFSIEVSLENTDLKRLPMYRNSISSLAVTGDFIVGGTSAKKGLSPFVFVASIKEQQMKNLTDLNEIVKGQRSIPTGYARGKNDVLFAGTIANANADGSNGDGHLIEVKIGNRGQIKVKDLGVPVPGEGIFALTAGGKGTWLYGITYPSGIFFKYNVGTGAVKTFDDLVPSRRDIGRLHDYALNPEHYLGKALIEDNSGVIYGSAPINRIFAFDPKDDSFTILDSPVPEVWGRRTMGQIESWAKSADGILYGGNAGDGQLFTIDPATRKVTNLGKPIMMPRLRGLAFAQDGKLYGVAGGAPGYTHLFSYDAKGAGFVDLGNPEFRMVAPGIEQGILWRGFQIGTLTTSEDGKYVVMGEDEDLSQLLIFAVGEYNEGRIGY